MALIKCHECKAEISSEAVTCPKCGAKPKKPVFKRNFGCGTLILIGLILAIVAAILPDSNTTAVRAPAPGSVGTEVALRVSSGDVVVTANEAAYQQFVKMSVASDFVGMAQMEVAGLLFRVPSGTKARVIDSGIGRRQVRIMEGQKIGASGWVPAEVAAGT